MASENISSQALLQSLREAQAAVGEREGELEAARSHVGIARRERDLLLELGRLRGIPKNELEAITGVEAPSTNGGSTPAPERAQNESTERSELQTTIATVLRERGEPVHIGELMSSVRERGATIPGRGEQANLISFMSRHDEFVRPARGHYGLREWGLEEARPASKRRRPRAKSSR